MRDATGSQSKENTAHVVSMVVTVAPRALWHGLLEIVCHGGRLMCIARSFLRNLAVLALQLLLSKSAPRNDTQPRLSKSGPAFARR